MHISTCLALQETRKQRCMKTAKIDNGYSETEPRLQSSQDWSKQPKAVESWAGRVRNSAKP